MGEGEAASEQEVDCERALAYLKSPMLIEGVWAEIEVGGEHLRLFAEHNAQGVQSSVYNVKAKCWISPSEAVEDIEQRKEQAEEYARAYLRKVAGSDLPPPT